MTPTLIKNGELITNGVRNWQISTCNHVCRGPLSCVPDWLADNRLAFAGQGCCIADHRPSPAECSRPSLSFVRLHTMNRPAVALICFLVTLAPSISSAASKPNIVFILADDMGVGDVMSLSKRCRIETPNLDRLASQGMAFTDAHTSSSVCTPTRYAILTGRYNWRSRLKNGVCWGWSRRLIEDGRMTVGLFLQQNCRDFLIAKWLLRLL